MPTTYAIPDGRTVMAATLYAGTSVAQSIVNTVNGVSFQPDFVWGKNRTNVNSHRLTDVNRGVGKVLFSDGTAGDTTGDGQLSSFNSNGFSLTGGAGAFEGLNQSGNNYVAWQWKAGGTAVSNTAGSITSSVSANTTAGFSVVTYTGTGANATVGHGLNATPAMILVKNRDSGAIGGAVYHTSIGATKYLKLFQTTTGTDSEATDNTAWNGGSPTFNSSVFSIGSLNRTNSSQQMVAYCFAPVAGYSAFGSYTGNDSNDGPFVYLGFRPRFVMFKNTTSSGSWVIFDTSRDPYNVEQNYLFPNQSTAENGLGSVVPQVDYLSNGFKLRANNANAWQGNQSGNIFIYAAFAENPFKYANAR
jgi:hypothetical protein